MATSTTTKTTRKTTRTRKAPAKAAPAKKAAAKAAPAKKAKAEKHAFEATGRGGKTNVRTYPTADIRFAVDVADPEAKSAAGRAGLIFRMFADEAKAQAFAAKHNEAGRDAIVVPAKAVR